MKEYLLSIFKEKPGEIGALNGFRGYGIFAVMIGHIWDVPYTLSRSYPEMIAYPPILEDFIRNFMSFMDLFFILSGFLIYGGLIISAERKKSAPSISKFYLKRTLRIFPVYYFFLAVSFFLAKKQIWAFENKVFINPFEKMVLVQLKKDMSKWLYDFTYTSNYFEGNINHGWSLSLEEQFYLVVPFFVIFILLKLSSHKRKVLLAFLYVIPLLFRFLHTYLNKEDPVAISEYIYRATHTRADSLFLGMILFESYHTRDKFYQLLDKYRVPFFIGALAVLLPTHFCSRTGTPYFFNTIKYNFFNLSYAVLMLLVTIPDFKLSKLHNSVILRPIARLSYSIYLWHITVIVMVMGKNVKPGNFSWGRVFGYGLWSIILTIILAYLCYILVEQPFLILKDKIGHIDWKRFSRLKSSD